MDELWSPHLIESITFGPWQVHAVADARFRADGGVAFSMVPRTLWEREMPAAADHTIPLRVGVLLLERGSERIVIDTGLGLGRVGRYVRGFFGDLSHTGGLSRALSLLGWAPDSISELVMTHLHVDHAGGLFDESGAGLFPAARITLARKELAYALNPHPLRGPVYDTRAAQLLSLRSDVTLVDDLPREVSDGLEVRVLGGHTPGHLAAFVRAGNETLVHAGDIIPTRAHRRSRWVLSYDQSPTTVYEQRRRLTRRGIAEGWLFYFGHDPRIAFGRIHPGGEVEEIRVEGRGRASAS
jgi:glyoxylase-like metal-dependent hydrolase (beta-lactamase superfamily II)